MMRLALIGIMAFLLVFGIGRYLSPDDLKKCDIANPSPGGGCATADAIVVISGGDTIARTDGAIRLFRAGWAPLIVLSGAAADKNSPSNAVVMQEHAVANGVPSEATIIEGESETTKQNAEQVREQLRSRGVQDIILVTSGYHMRRASLEFSKQFDTITVRSHPVTSDNQWSEFWWLTPWGWWTALSELVKIAVFYVGGTR